MSVFCYFDVALKSYGHNVTIFTSRFEPSRAFTETTDGSLKIVPVPSAYKRHFMGKLHIVFALLRAVELSRHVAQVHKTSKKKQKFDAVFCDQVSAYVPGKSAVTPLHTELDWVLGLVGQSQA